MGIFGVFFMDGPCRYNIKSHEAWGFAGFCYLLFLVFTIYYLYLVIRQLRFYNFINCAYLRKIFRLNPIASRPFNNYAIYLTFLHHQVPILTATHGGI